MKDKIYKLILAILDTFLILFFMFFTAYIFTKNGVTKLNIMQTYIYSFCITVMPAICKYVALKIEKETDIKEKVIDHLLHMLSGYIVFLLVVSITKHMQNQILSLLISIITLIIMYLLCGEYSFALLIDTANSRKEKHEIAKKLIENEEIHKLLTDKTCDEATVLVIIDIYRNEKGKLDTNFKEIKVDKKGEITKEDELFEESDK